MPNTLGGDGATEFQVPYTAKHLNCIYKVLQSYNKVGFNKKKTTNKQTLCNAVYVQIQGQSVFVYLKKRKKKIIRTKLIKKKFVVQQLISNIYRKENNDQKQIPGIFGNYKKLDIISI